MNPTSKKFIALFLAFSLLTINCATLRTTGGKREKHGAKLIVTKKDGQQIEGELITVKPNLLLLLDTEGKDVSIEIVDIKVIRIVKKSKAAGKGALTGLKIGGGLGLIAFVDDGDEEHSAIASFIDTIILIGLPAALIGSVIGGAAGKGKTIQIEGMTDSETKEALEKLRKKARIPDYK